MKKITVLLFCIIAYSGHAQVLSESFDDITTLTDWDIVNVSSGVGTATWFQGNDGVFPAQSGDPTAYIGCNFNSTTGASTISNWLIMPVLNLQDTDMLEFWTRTATASNFPDRLEVRMSTAGAGSTDPVDENDVGSYTELLLEINPGLALGGYPEVWELQSINIDGLGVPTDVRIAFRYFVTDGGPSGSNSNFIGIDEVNVISPLSVEEFEQPKISHYFDQNSKQLSISAQVVLNEVSVYNILGQETKRIQLNDSEAQVNMSDLQAGVYIARIVGDNNASKTIKFVVK